MNYPHLGRTGLKVSRLALGTMNFGELTDEATSFSIMDKALEAGINLFDTADVYGGPQSPDMEKGYGISEEIIGRWLAQGGRRDRIVLATKVYQPMEIGPNDRHLSAYHIRRACDASLRRLKTDHIDLYQLGPGGGRYIRGGGYVREPVRGSGLDLLPYQGPTLRMVGTLGSIVAGIARRGALPL